jgi:hypothetical protein
MQGPVISSEPVARDNAAGDPTRGHDARSHPSLMESGR